MSRELLGCPFCGTAPERDKGWGGYMKCGNIQCVLGGPDDEALWISESAWNTRAPMSVTNDPRVVEVIEALKECVGDMELTEAHYGQHDGSQDALARARAAIANMEKKED